MCRRTTFSVVFFCKKTKVNKKGKAPVYARITTSGQATEIYTQCQVEPEHWSQRLERCMLRKFCFATEMRFIMRWKMCAGTG